MRQRPLTKRPRDKIVNTRRRRRDDEETKKEASGSLPNGSSPSMRELCTQQKRWARPNAMRKKAPQPGPDPVQLPEGALPMRPPLPRPGAAESLEGAAAVQRSVDRLLAPM